jgi:AcrR family transcriptional regulator
MARPRTVSDAEVLAAAAAAVASVGPARLTLAEVGVRVGLSPATLLQRFGSKRGLLLALARAGAETMPARLRTARGAAQPAAALVEVFAEMADGVRTSAEFANHLGFLLLDLSDPEFQSVARAHAAAIEASIDDVLAASRTAGELAPLPPGASDLLPRALHAGYNGALVTWGMTGQGNPADAVREHLRQLLTPHQVHSDEVSTGGEAFR